MSSIHDPTRSVYSVTITSQEQAELLEAPRPESALEPHEVAGTTQASLISPGTELAAAYCQDQGHPRVPGYAAVFRVEAVGAEVSHLEVGDLSFCMGKHCSYQRYAAPATLKVPAGLAPEAAVFARLMGVTMSTLTTTRARPPARVIVAGLGPVGLLAAKIFQSCGYRVLGCDPILARQELARQGGIRHVGAAIPLGDKEWEGQVALVIECAGHEAAVLDGCRIVAPGGEVVLVGTPWKRRTDIYAHAVLDAVFHRYVSLRGGWEWELPRHAAEFRNNSIWGNLEAALDWLQGKRVEVEGMYALRSPRQCQAAYQDLLHGRAEKPAIVFDWTNL